MPTIPLAIWKCTAASSHDFDWQDQTLTDRLLMLAAAVDHVSERVTDPTVVLPPGRLLAIFMSPEYTLAAPAAGNPIPAEHIPLSATARMFTQLEKLSAEYPNILIIPGSYAFKTETHTQNNAVGYFGGESILYAGKKYGVGEANGTGLEFKPGDGLSRATVDHLELALQICKDATVADTLTVKVDLHLIVGQGVGLDAVKSLAPRIARAVADPFCSGVFSYTGGALAAENEVYNGIGIAYYAVPI